MAKGGLSILIFDGGGGGLGKTASYNGPTTLSQFVVLHWYSASVLD